MSKFVPVICTSCGGNELKDCGTYLKCMNCDAIFKLDESMSKEEMDEHYRQLFAFENAERELTQRPPRFDEAESQFELITQKYPRWSAGYWGLVRAKFGIKFEHDADG